MGYSARPTKIRPSRQSQTVYDRYMKYLTGCAKLFRQGYTADVDQFTLKVTGQRWLPTGRCPGDAVSIPA